MRAIRRLAIAFCLLFCSTICAFANDVVVEQRRPGSLIPKVVHTYTDKTHKVEISTEYHFLSGIVETDFFRPDGTKRRQYTVYPSSAFPDTYDEYFKRDGVTSCKSVNQMNGTTTVIRDLKTGEVYVNRFDIDQFNVQYMNVEINGAGGLTIYSQTWEVTKTGYKLVSVVDKTADGRDREVTMSDDGLSVVQAKYFVGTNLLKEDPDANGVFSEPVDLNDPHLNLMPDANIVGCPK